MGFIRRDGIYILLVWFCLTLWFSFLPLVNAQESSKFIATGNMTMPRVGHNATLLPNGKVLITGGRRNFSSKPERSAELFDPVTGTFTPTGEMTTGRYYSSATPLPDGRVLIIGGEPLGTTELYDPSTGTFAPAGNTVTTPGDHQATLLVNGKVLITGSATGCPPPGSFYDGCVIANNPEIYDPATGISTLTGDYADRSSDSWFGTRGLIDSPATVLPGGTVLIASERRAEIYNPATGTFRVTGQMTRGVNQGRVPAYGIAGTSTLLLNGKVLLAGGEWFEYDIFADAELYDFGTGSFTSIGKMTRSRGSHSGDSGHTATLLSDGTVLIVGGTWVPVAHGSAEIYDPASGTFRATAEVTTQRILGNTATLLMNGRVLITGGLTSWPNVTAAAELYTPAPDSSPVTIKTSFSPVAVGRGGSFTATFSGPNLTDDTYFDVRFQNSASNSDQFVLNWQRGPSQVHSVPIDLEAGTWAITGVRAHESIDDHRSGYFPVLGLVTVSPQPVTDPSFNRE